MQRLKKCKASRIKGISNYNSEEELLQILNERKQYLEYVYKLKNLSESELANLSFDNVQIDAIKNFDGSDEMAARASATVLATLKLTKFNYTASDKRTHAFATFSGSWKGTPRNWYDWFIIKICKKNSSNAITHYDGGIVRNTYGEYNSSAGPIYKFAIADNNLRVFKKFTMTYTASADGKNTLMDYGAAYVHFREMLSVTGLNIGVSGTGASLGISFSANKKGDFEWKNVYPRSSYI